MARDGNVAIIEHRDADGVRGRGRRMGDKRTRVSGAVCILLPLRSSMTNHRHFQSFLDSRCSRLRFALRVVASRLVNEGIRTEETVHICTHRYCVE